MGCHLLCNDGLGRYMSIFCYVLMLLGNGLVYLTSVKPKLDTDERTDTLIEYACYGFFWSMMVISHLRTMCVDPGFIPKDYEVKENVLAAPFNTLKDLEAAYKSNRNPKASKHIGRMYSLNPRSNDSSKSKISSIQDESVQVTSKKSSLNNTDNEA